MHFNCSDWKERRMVFTESVVAFAHIGAEKMLDVIPLDEIDHIQDCDGIDVVETDENAGRVLLEIELKVCTNSFCVFLLRLEC